MCNIIKSVIAAGMCSGCGLCVEKPNEMYMTEEGYLRPQKISSDEKCGLVCPGKIIRHYNKEAPYHLLWGPILSARVGASTDASLRYAGSSGGVISTLLVMMLENDLVDMIVQVGASRRDPLMNETFVHKRVDKIKRNAGSRYAPSSPLSIVKQLIGDERRYVVVGKPCDVATLRAYLHSRPEIKKQFPYLISFFCAGVPSQKGTDEILKRMGINKKEVVRFRYRGNGWPGMTRAETQRGCAKEMTYNEVWGRVLNKYIQPRCKMCADGSGEAADIVCADAWYKANNDCPSFEENEGRSLIIGRTRRGEELLKLALLKKYISGSNYQIDRLEEIQQYQAKRKRTMLSRQLAMLMLNGHPPCFKEHALVKNAMEAGLLNSLKAFIGTILRRLKKRV